MADNFRYRDGETNPVLARVTTAQGITLGDCLGASTGFLYGGGDQAWVDLSTSQYNFAANFAGVAMQRKTAGTAKPGAGGGMDNRLRVATEGEFEFDTPASTLAFGQLLGLSKASGNALDPQKLEYVSDLTRAVARVTRPKTVAASTTVFCRIFSKHITKCMFSNQFIFWRNFIHILIVLVWLTGSLID